jgi:hypothetical protein
MISKKYYLCASILLTLLSCCLAFAQSILDEGKIKRLRVLNYDWQVDIDYSQKTYTSNCRVEVKNNSKRQIYNIPFLLYRLVKVDSIVDDDGKVLEFNQDVVEIEDEPDWQVNLVIVKLNSPLSPDQTRSFSFRYSGYMLGYQEIMAYTKDNIKLDFTILRKDCFAYPDLSYPSWKAMRERGFEAFDYKIAVTVPRDYVVANGGRLLSERHADEKVTFMYENIKKAWRMDIAIAQYTIVEDEEKKLRIYCFKEEAENASRILLQMAETFSLYTGWFKPIKNYSGYTLIEIPEGYGSQADVTCILQTADAFRQEKSIVELYHEIAHQWNPPSKDPLPARWESEGFAMFMQNLAYDTLKGCRKLEEAMELLRQRYIKACEQEPRGISIPIIDYGREDIFYFSYTKGAWLFYVLYNLVGQEDFNGIIAAYYNKYYETGATSEDFVRLAKKMAGRDLDLFFKEWLFTARSSQYLIDNIPLQDILQKYK